MMFNLNNTHISDEDLNVKKCQEYVFAQGYGKLCKSTKKYMVFASDTAFKPHLNGEEEITFEFACPKTCRMYEGMFVKVL